MKKGLVFLVRPWSSCKVWSVFEDDTFKGGFGALSGPSQPWLARSWTARAIRQRNGRLGAAARPQRTTGGHRRE